MSTRRKQGRASMLLPGPPVPGHRILRDEQQHAWLIDDTLLRCTPTEYACLQVLLEHVERCVPFARLIAQFQEVPLTDAGLQRQARLKVIHLMSDLRARLWALDLDIVSVMRVGYLLLRTDTEDASATDAQTHTQGHDHS